MTKKTPPALHVVIQALRSGLGVEDIAQLHQCRTAQIREIVDELRHDGVIQNIRFEKSRACT